MFYVGTAGWSIPQMCAKSFASEGSHLERYSRVFSLVEINSSFYRDHKPETYAKWAAATPDGFQFSVKLSREFTQKARLTEFGSRLRDNILAVSALGKKFAILLVQLPPSLQFDRGVAEMFFSHLEKYCACEIVVEPRHASWASVEAVKLFDELRISKVLADPEPCEVERKARARVQSTVYVRLHGTPQIYKSKYDDTILERVARIAKSHANKDVRVIFDNTYYGFATENALRLTDLLC